MKLQQINKTNQGNHQRETQLFAKPALPLRAQVHPLLHLQRTLGNHALGRFIQAKLKINLPGDVYEQEADRISEQVMSISAPQLQRTCTCDGGCHKCQTEQPGREHESLQTKRVGSSDLGQTSVPPIVHEVLRSPGQPLDPATRGFMEPRFGHDFSRVQVHSDARGAESAQAVKALAYTAGRHLVFGAGQYSPTTASGRRLLAHELAHSVQQGFAANPLQTTLLQREDVLIPEIEPPYSEETSTRSSYSAHETVPPDCRENSLVLSWEKDTCCSNRGFPDPAAKNKTTGAACCNTFPTFVETEAINRGFDGAASCKPKYIRHSATVTPNDNSKSVKVICTDTRANNNDVIELSQKAAVKAFENAHLRERAKVCYGDSEEPGTCYVKTDCNKTVNPRESQCLPAGCSKIDAAGSTKKPDKPKK